MLRKPARLKPESPGLLKEFVIHAQGLHRRSSGSGSSRDRLLIIRPAKMSFPDLCARVEESNLRSSSRVDAPRLVRFRQIARGAGQSPIARRIGAALCLRNDVFEVKPIAADTLRCVTVFAAATGAFFHPTAQDSCG